MKTDKISQRICAIHQPNFFPWIGYFNKIYRSNKFVLLDNVLKSGGSNWGNRVSIIVGGKPFWINILIKNHIKMIKDIELATSTNWGKKIEKTLSFNYGRAQYYAETMEYLAQFLNSPFTRLAEFNEWFIRETCNKLNIDTLILNQSQLHTEEKSTRLLIEITKLVDCNVYMCGGGAEGYQEDYLFEEQGIEIMYQNFIHPYYKQLTDDFISGQSIIDTLFHCGFAGTEKLIKVGKIE